MGTALQLHSPVEQAPPILIVQALLLVEDLERDPSSEAEKRKTLSALSVKAEESLQ